MEPFVEAAAAVGVLVAIGFFLKFLRWLTKQHTAERREWLGMMANHIDHNTDAITELIRAIDRWQAKQ